MTADPTLTGTLVLTARGPAEPRRSPLAHRSADLAGLRGSVSLAELPYLTQLNLRVDPVSPAAARIEQALGLPLPGPNCVSGSLAVTSSPAGDPHPEDSVAADLGATADLGSGHGPAVLWLGPDEWLVVGPDGAGPDLIRGLHEALVDHVGSVGDVGSVAHAGSVVDVSANRTTLVLRGPSARALLEKGCTLDLHPRSFTAGQCAQTTFARALMILWQTAAELPIPDQWPPGPEYRLLVRSSFANYFADWLLDAAGEFTTASDVGDEDTTKL